MPPGQLRTPASWPGGWLTPALCVVLLSVAAIVGAAQRTSLTFDEVFMIPSGARGYALGRFDMTLDHPPVTQYLYGLPVHLASPHYPPEAGKNWSFDNRFQYGRDFFFRSGNDPEALALRARIMGALVAAALILSVFFFTRRRFGGGPALLAATLTAFLPDVLAHGGVAYNDLPLALAYFLGVWTLDHAARDPSPRRFALAAFACTVAIGTKLSGVALGPAAVLLFGLEAHRQGHDRAWYGRVLRAFVVIPPVAYLTLVAIYLGDPTLADFRWAFDHVVGHAEKGHGVPALLLGERSIEGFRSFFLIAFFLKTPAALHLLAALAVVGFVRHHRARSRSEGREWLGSELRVPLVGAVVFLAFLIRANLNIGFRHALPLLPCVTVLIAIGAGRLWAAEQQRIRAAIVALALTHAGSALASYPWFLSYLSVYAGDRAWGHQVLVDSSLDWGQGLLALRDWMQAEKVDRVYLSYFGSALPEAYGVAYAPLVSYFPLLKQETAEDATAPRYVVISATNLAGSYLSDDPFAGFRGGRPHSIIAGSLYVYPVGH